MTKFSSIRQTSTTQTVAKKHLKTHLKRIRNREYCRLRDMVPAIANKQKVSKVSTQRHPVVCILYSVMLDWLKIEKCCVSLERKVVGVFWYKIHVEYFA